MVIRQRQPLANIGLEPTVPRVTPPAKNGNRRAARPAAQSGRYKDSQISGKVLGEVSIVLLSRPLPRPQALNWQVMVTTSVGMGRGKVYGFIRERVNISSVGLGPTGNRFQVVCRSERNGEVPTERGLEPYGRDAGPQDASCRVVWCRDCQGRFLTSPCSRHLAPLGFLLWW